LSELLNRCLTDIQWPINPNILKNFNNYLGAIQKSEHSNHVKILLDKYLEAHREVERNILEAYYCVIPFDSFRRFAGALGLLKSLKDHRSTVNQQILRFRNIIQELLKLFNSAL
jgi:hypothetical protein